MSFLNNKVVLAFLGILVIAGIFGFVFWQQSSEVAAPIEASNPKFADKNNEEQTLINIRDERTRSGSPEEKPLETKMVERPVDATFSDAPPPPLPRAPVRTYGTISPAPTSPTERLAEVVATRRDWRHTAPYGRLLKCSLMNTLQSIDLKTPIIGVVTEDLMWAGEVIIPAGTEVHGRAANERSRSRLGAAGKWILILKEDEHETRREMIINGLVLDRSYDPETDTFGPLDGSAGFRGEIIEEVDDKLIKLFAATFIQGLSGALTETSRNDAGTLQVVPSVRNGALGGTQEVLGEVAQQIRASIEREGYYTQVAGGTEFYIYIEEGVDRKSARKGLTMKRSFTLDPETEVSELTPQQRELLKAAAAAEQ